MVGVSVPVIVAAVGNIPAVIFGIAMFFCGGLLVVSIRSQKTKYQLVLLGLNVLIATVVLVGVLVFHPHTFLVIWSALIIMLSAVSGRLLSSRGTV